MNGKIVWAISRSGDTMGNATNHTNHWQSKQISSRRYVTNGKGEGGRKSHLARSPSGTRGTSWLAGVCACATRAHKWATIWWVNVTCLWGEKNMEAKERHRRKEKKRETRSSNNVLLTFSRILPRFLESFRSTSEPEESCANGGCSAFLKPKANTRMAHISTIPTGIAYTYCECCSSRPMWSIATHGVRCSWQKQWAWRPDNLCAYPPRGNNMQTTHGRWQRWRQRWRRWTRRLTRRGAQNANQIAQQCGMRVLWWKRGELQSARWLITERWRGCDAYRDHSIYSSATLLILFPKIECACAK